MNYLAHLYLARDCPDHRVGGLMGDFLKGVRLADLDEGVLRGVRLHLRVDAFTDAHPVVHRSKRRIAPEHRRYAGVLVDVFYDHFLAAGWERYSPTPLPAYAAEVYALLAERAASLPPSLHAAAGRMAQEDWLSGYARLSGIETALRRLSRRLKRPHDLGAAVQDLVREYEPLRADFEAFFPEVVRYTQGDAAP